MEKNIDDCSLPNEWVKYYSMADKDMDNQWNGMLLPILK